MKIIVLYDSQFGNTKKLADGMVVALRKSDSVKLFNVIDARLTDVTSAELLVVGSPTQGGRPTPALQSFLDNIPSGALKGINVVAFDTRFEAKNVNFFLKILMGVIDFAAPKIARILTAKGGHLAAEPAGFIVTGKEGPLKEGEFSRAAVWVTSLHNSIFTHLRGA